MIQVLEYIVQHYAWFLGGSILVLLAIIGYYADKTNFGQGKNSELENENQEDKANTIIEEAVNREQIGSEMAMLKQDGFLESHDLNYSKIEANDVISTTVKENVVEDSTNTVPISNDNKIDTKKLVTKKINKTAEEVAFDKFKEEFDSVLPQKDIINADLLSDIDELSLEKTQKINLNELPDLDDIELPKIKNLVSDEQDIWKF